MDNTAAETEACTDCPADDRDSRRWSRLLTAGLVLDIVLTVVLLADIAATWHGRRQAPPAPAAAGRESQVVAR